MLWHGMVDWLPAAASHAAACVQSFGDGVAFWHAWLPARAQPADAGQLVCGSLAHEGAASEPLTAAGNRFAGGPCHQIRLSQAACLVPLLEATWPGCCLTPACAVLSHNRCSLVAAHHSCDREAAQRADTPTAPAPLTSRRQSPCCRVSSARALHRGFASSVRATLLTTSGVVLYRKLPSGKNLHQQHVLVTMFS